MNASDRLDIAISRLEEISDAFEKVARGYEDADASYKLEFIKARARAKGTVDDRKYEAERACMDSGADDRLRAARVRLEANKEQSRNIRTIIEALRTQCSNERVGI